MIIGFDGVSAVYDNKKSQNYSRLVLDALSQDSDTDYFYIYSPSLIDNSYLVPIMSKANVFVKIQKHGVSSFMWRSVHGVLRSIKRHHVQLYHGLCGQLPLCISHKNAAMVVTFEDTGFLQARGVCKAKTRFMARMACHKADAIITLTNQSRQQLIDAYNLDPERVVVIPPSFSSAFQDNLNDTLIHAAIAKYKLPRRYIFYNATIDEHSHLLETLQALERCSDTELCLVAAGHSSAKYMAKLKEWASRHGMASRFLNLPPVRTVYLPGIMSKAVACLCTTDGHSFPYSAIYAQATAVPLIAPHEIRDITAQAALTIDLTSVDAITGAINDIVTNETTRQRLVGAARDNVARFTPQALATAHRTLYHSIIDRLNK